MNKRARSQLEKTLRNKNSCYILITCGEPSETGEMQIEMTYQGDAALASYLLQGAQTYIDEKI